MTPTTDRNVMPEIKGFNKSTLLDWDGQIASIVFLPGCNYRCPYCHASALVTEPDTQPNVPLGEVDTYLAQNRGWIDGVVITGGEPTLQPGLFDLIDHLIEQGLKIKLFTNGSQPDVLRELIRTGRLAAVSMDIKGPLDERYERAAGVSVDLDAIRASIDILMSLPARERGLKLMNDGIPYEFRTTVCPELLTHDDVVDIARAVRGAGLLTLQQFRPVDCLDPAFEHITPYGENELDRMAEAASEFVERCTVVK